MAKFKYCENSSTSSGFILCGGFFLKLTQTYVKTTLRINIFQALYMYLTFLLQHILQLTQHRTQKTNRIFTFQLLELTFLLLSIH